jgi:hypothetical protein
MKFFQNYLGNLKYGDTCGQTKNDSKCDRLQNLECVDVICNCTQISYYNGTMCGK